MIFGLLSGFGKPARALGFAIALAFMSMGTTAAHAEDTTPRQHLEDAANSFIQALDLLLRTIPQYAAPEVLENGDIIIRRKNPKDEETSPEPEAKNETRT